MTTQECNIAYRQQLPVKIKETKSNPDLKGGQYRITKLGNRYIKRFREFQYFVVIEKYDNPREIYELPMRDIEAFPGYEHVIQSFINSKTEVLKAECTRMLKGTV